ncbi:MAG: PqiC family protein [bacterium]
MKYRHLLLLACAVLVVQGCATRTSPEARYYRMSSMLDHGHSSETKLVAHDFLLGVGPVKLADYLDRPQIIQRSSSNTLQMNEFDRWSGSLQDNMQITLTENLKALLGKNKVIGFPWPRAIDTDYHVSVRVTRFDSQGNDVVLRASWILLGKDDEKLLTLQTTEIREPAASPDYDQLVAARSRTLDRLAIEISSQLERVINNSNAQTLIPQ